MWGVWLQGFNATTAFLLPDPFTPRQAFMESFNATTAFLLPRWLAKMRWSN